MTPAAAALAYAARGWPVFPVRLVPKMGGGFDKIPCLNWATTAVKAIDARDPALIAMWWRCTPDALIGMPTGPRSGVVVLDIDRKNGKDGFDTLDRLGKPVLPNTPLAITPTNGRHVYFACAGPEIRNSAGKDGIGPGIDIRGAGGMIILPTPGTGYEWHPIWNLSVPLYPAPAWLGHRAEKPAPAKPLRSAASSRPAKPVGSATRTFVSSAAAQIFLDVACENISAAVPGERHAIIVREVYSIAKLVASGALDERHVTHELGAAVAEMVSRTGGNLVKAERDLRDAWTAGRAG